MYYSLYALLQSANQNDSSYISPVDKRRVYLCSKMIGVWIVCLPTYHLLKATVQPSYTVAWLKELGQRTVGNRKESVIMLSLLVGLRLIKTLQIVLLFTVHIGAVR